MIKNRLLNIWLIANLGMVWLVPQPSLAFSLFGPSDAEKQILFLQGYNAGVARVTATDGTTELTPVNTVKTKTTAQTYPAATTVTTNSSVTNPLSADLDTGNFKIINSNSDRTIRLDGNLTLQNGQWPWALSAPRVNVENHEANVNAIDSYAYGDRSTAGQFTVSGANTKAGSFMATGLNSYAIFAKAGSFDSATSSGIYAGYFDGKVDIKGGLRAANLLVGDFGQEISADIPIMGIGVTSGVVGTAMGWTEGHGVTGNGFYGVAGFASQNNGAGIYGKVVSGIENAYAGYFDGRVVVKDGLRTNKICVGNNLEDPGACLQSEGIVSTAANDSIVGNALSESGTGVLGQGFKGVYGRAVGNNSIGVYGAVASGSDNALAARFDGETEIAAGNLIFSNNLNPRIDINNNVYSTFGIKFNFNPSSNIVFTSDNRLGIGTDSPNSNLHLKTTNGNAELDIQSGNNQHWGIYQNMTGGALNFWHGDNRLTINDKGITTNGICIDKTCITKWEDLKAILNTTPLPTKTGVVPAQQ